MTGDKAVELINEWLNLAKEVGDMNLNRMEYDEERYNYAMDRMDVIRQEINEYQTHSKFECHFRYTVPSPDCPYVSNNDNTLEFVPTESV